MSRRYDNDVNKAKNMKNKIDQQSKTETDALTLILFRRQPEHFMKVSCQRMGSIFGLHLALASLYFSLYSFAACHQYDWDLTQQEYICADHIRATKEGREQEERIDVVFTTSRPPNPATVPTPINVIVIVLNVLSNTLLPLIPGSFMYTVQTLLVE